MYGWLGAASFFFEIGTSFYQPCETLSTVINEVFPALLVRESVYCIAREVEARFSCQIPCAGCSHVDSTCCIRLAVCGQGCQAAIQGSSRAGYSLHYDNFYLQWRREVHIRDDRGKRRRSYEAHRRRRRRLLHRPADHKSGGDLRELSSAVLRDELPTDEDCKHGECGHVDDGDDAIQGPEQDQQRDVHPGRRFVSARWPGHRSQIRRGFALVMLGLFRQVCWLIFHAIT